jgi:hypothetical protein
MPTHWLHLNCGFNAHHLVTIEPGFLQARYEDNMAAQHPHYASPTTALQTWLGA